MAAPGRTLENANARFWIGIVAVLLIAAGSVAAAIAVYVKDRSDFQRVQQDEALRAAHQAESVAALSVGQLSTAAAFLQAETRLGRREFEVIGHSLLQGGTLEAAAFIPRVPASERGRYEREHRLRITEPTGLGEVRPAGRRSVYYPLTFVASAVPGGPQRALGFDVGADPGRYPFLRQAAMTGRPVATPVIPLILGGTGVNLYRAVYRDGAPTATAAERRRALVGFAAGSFRVARIMETATAAVPAATALQLRSAGRPIAGPANALEGGASAAIHIANTTWRLVAKDPGGPNLSLPLALALMGIALAALLASLVVGWNRSERIRELELEARQDALTGLNNRRRFVEDLRAAMARARREGATGALLILDLDDFKRINDTHGHPAGDRLLEEIAELLRRRTRAGDSLARLGGDEFAVILPRCTRKEATAAARSIGEAIREHRPQSGAEPVTASVGMAMFGAELPPRPATIVSEADMAMYVAKEEGRDGVRVFDEAAREGKAPGRR